MLRPYVHHQVHLCEAFHLQDYISEIGASFKPNASRSTVVLVKTLRRNANDLAR
jgi:hypothetical protein